MGLQKYSEKRNFKNTPEPKGKKATGGKQLAFVVQRHRASHLHYDFRLEMEGVMKSWAVPKGPSLNPQDKRLAMMVEDHPYDYNKFEGIIPEGNYGAGTVEIWDNGTYTASNANGKDPEKELLKELHAGNLKFTMSGKKLKGEFALVKLKNDSARNNNSWLLIKHRDEHAVDEDYSSEDYPSLTAMKGKTFMNEPAKKVAKKKAKPEPEEEEVASRPVRTSRFSKKVHLEKYVKPMLAKETDEPFNSDDWVFEIKYDGYRAIAETGKELRFYSRNGISFLHQYPEITEELEQIRDVLILDGEVVALNSEGQPEFQLLQHFDPAVSTLAYYVFDILRKGKKDLTSLPLTERKEILQSSVEWNDVIRYSDHIESKGIDFFNLLRKRGMEGIIAKRADSIYAPGERTGNWLKIKNHQGQEAIIVGFTEPRKSRKFFGSLVLGVYDKGKLRYAGHTGTGFNDKTLKEVSAQLKTLITQESPFKEKVKTNMPVTWVKPKLVANIKFSNWTKDGYMRHPVFLGLREDKEPQEVIDEKTRKVAAPSGKKTQSVKKKKTMAATVQTAKNSSAVKSPAKKQAGKESGEIKLNGKQVNLTNTSKIYFPADKITKGDIIDYYQSVADYILPYLKDRPESLLRTPNGIADKGFFHKDAGDTAPEWVKSKKIFSESVNKDIDYLVCNDKATLAYMNNLGCIELNPWHSRITSLEYPDYMAIDLDPSPENTFDEVIETALAVKEVFESCGATCLCKTSGASGLHIYAPLGAKYTYDEVKDFANIIAIMVSEKLPDTTSVVRPLKQRGNKIYVDFLQNRKGQTLACAYSARPREGATVSTPLEWKEVKKGLHPSQFNIKNTLKRLSKTGDLFKPVLGKGIDLEKCLKKLGA